MLQGPNQCDWLGMGFRNVRELPAPRSHQPTPAFQQLCAQKEATRLDPGSQNLEFAQLRVPEPRTSEPTGLARLSLLQASRAEVGTEYGSPKSSRSSCLRTWVAEGERGESRLPMWLLAAVN